MQRLVSALAVVLVVFAFCLARPMLGAEPANIPKKKSATDPNKPSSQVFSIINKLDFSDLLAGKQQLGPDDLKNLRAQLISSAGISAENVTVVHLERRAVIIQGDVPAGFIPNVLSLTLK